MMQITSIRTLIELWPTRKELAADLGVTTDRVHKWAQGNTIPAKFHLSVIRSANRRNLPVTADLLARLHDDAARDEAA
jgi:DNA-binding transcriptional regulator YiaG